ncbi:MAG TPA: hypothetical protein P5295_14300 [Spirochaetota bacterium]|nr:hypothetical protein [Spirochaetota bacterium]
MKKISLLVLALLLWIIPACDDDDNSTSSSNGTLVVNFDFDGAGDGGATPAISTDPDATKQIYVYLYNTMSLFPYEYYTYDETTGVAVDDAADFVGSITLNNIPAGDYYVLVFYDADYSQKSIARSGDPYMLYHSTDGTYHATASPYVAIKNDAGLVTITKGQTTTIPETGSMIYEVDAAVFGDQGAWDIP